METVNQHTQVKVSVASDTADAFKTACKVQKVSMASVLSGYMAKYSETALKVKPDLKTRRQRRTAVRVIIKRLYQIIAAEECYRDNVPENIQGSVITERAENFISALEEAVDLLDSVE
jgi:hypothetical protein